MAIEPHRIGYGVHLCRSSVDYILNNKIPIEMCPTSTVKTTMIDTHIKYPAIKYYLEYGHPIICSSDDSLLFNTCLSQEYVKLMDNEHITLENIQNIMRSSFLYRFS